MTENQDKPGDGNNDQEAYIGNIWGRKYTIYAALVVLIVFSIALCRYLVIQPDELIIEEDLEQFIN